MIKYGTESYNIYYNTIYLICGMQNGAKSKYIYTLLNGIYMYMPESPREPRKRQPRTNHRQLLNLCMCNMTSFWLSESESELCGIRNTECGEVDRDSSG